jgi:fibronectin type 3 domain-containing protein
MNKNPIIAALFASACLPSHAASDFTNALTTYTGTSQDNSANAATQPLFLTTPASGLEVSKLAAGFSAAAAFETIYFNVTEVALPEVPGVKFGGNRGNPTQGGGNDGRNYIRTVETNYNTQDFTAYVTVKRSAPSITGNRRTVFFGLGRGALNLTGANPDSGTSNAAAYFEMQNGFDNVSRRAQSDTQDNAQINYEVMSTVSSDSMRLRLQFDSVARTLIFSADYGYVPGNAFTADQTFFTANPTTFASQASKWAGGDRASIFFGGDRNIVFTDLNIDVTQPAVPPTPSGLSVASLGNNEVTLQWTTPVAIPGTTYSVYRSTTAGVFTDPAIATGLTTASYSDTTVVNGNTYYYRVTQSNTVALAAESVPSHEISASPVAGAITPTGVLASNAGKNALVVDWTDLLSPFESYTVRRATTSGGLFSIPPGGSGLATSRFVDENVIDGTTYYYTVTSTLGGIESAQTAEVSAASRALEVFVDFNNGTPTYSGAGGLAIAPVGTSWNGVETGSVANLLDSTLALSSVGLNATGQGAFSMTNGFGVGGDNVTPGSQSLTNADGYNLMQDYVFQNSAGTTTTYTLTGLIPDRKYDLYLYGYGNQLGQNTLFGSGSILKQTSNPAGLTTLTEGRHFVTFTAVAGQDGTVLFTWRNAFGATDADLNSGTALIAGFQLLENTFAVFQPTDMTAIGETSGVGLSWLDVENATTYKVYRSTTRAAGYSYLGTNGLNTNFTDTTGNSGVTYYYVVTALNGTDESFISAEVSGLKEPSIVDADADGLSDANEALIGTNPNSAADFFVAQSSSVTPSGGNYNVSFVINGAPGTYVIERSTTLQEGSWTEVADSNTSFTWDTGTVLTNPLTLSTPELTPAPVGKEFFRAKGMAPISAP